MYEKKTKIVCTLGPSSDSVTEIEALVKAGMNVARLNFSHGTYKHHKRMINNIRKVEKKTGKMIGIMQDLQGPKIRIGDMPEKGIKIKKGQTVILTIKNIEGHEEKDKIILPIQYKQIVKDVKKGDSIMIDDGLLEIKVEKVSKTELRTKVKVGGIVKSHKGVNVPTATISAKSITKKDREDLKWGLAHKVDYVALSFVKSKKDIHSLRNLIKKEGKNTKIIAKIERHEAVENLKEIVLAADGIMVARGDLGIEIPAEKVPIVQKRMIKLANKYSKPVITATQVLQSMVENAIATRAEISDAANSIFDHTDAIMLSNESAVGKYPVKAATTLKKVALTVEKELQKHPEILETMDAARNSSASDPTCINACELAIDANADIIVVYTEDGYTAREIEKTRLYIPIITITPKKQIARELTLLWGLNKTIVAKIKGKCPEKTDKIIKLLKKEKLIKKNSKVVIVCNASKEKLISTYNT